MGNIGERDQFDAAKRDTKKSFDELAEELDTPTFSGADPISEALIDTVMPGRKPSRVCKHLQRSAGPQPFFVASARPGFAYCARCFKTDDMTQVLAAHESIQVVCDSCHTTVPKPQNLSAMVVARGPATIIGKVCPSCKATSAMDTTA